MADCVNQQMICVQYNMFYWIVTMTERYTRNPYVPEYYHHKSFSNHCLPKNNKGIEFSCLISTWQMNTNTFVTQVLRVRK